MRPLELVDTRGAAGSEEQHAVRAVVVSDDALVRRGMRLVLEEAGMRAYDVEDVARGRRLCSGGSGSAAEVVVWMVDHLDAEVGATARDLLARADAPGVCVVAVRVDVAVARQLLSDHQQGIGILVRGLDTDAATLVDCVEEVARGGLSVAATLVSRILRQQGPAAELSPTEQEVLELLSAGWRNCEIARLLCRSEKSIENHIRRVFSKLGLDGKLHAGIDRRVTAAMLYAADRRVSLAFHGEDPSLGAAAAVSA